ncbi:hypothetical protein [Novosphingobium olei]|uniref:hypothetical protein n=1 Tax=Novosphingobium olei TaxID=2728851 RepID=UPI0030906DC2|nr:hypothetical protein NSDW_10760 [Novosphingobium olei]
MSFPYLFRWRPSNEKGIDSLSEDSLATMQFQFAQVEQALADMHRVAPEKRSAFQGRLKHYQKQGFPPGINTGRGRAAVYYVRHAVQLAVALEMNQVGLNPERTVRICTEYSGRIQGAVMLATSRMLSDDAEPVLLVFDPIVLSDLRGEEEWDETEATFDVKGVEEFRMGLENLANLRSRRYALVNISEVIDELSHRLGEASKYNEFDVMREIRASSSNVGAWRDGNP